MRKVNLDQIDYYMWKRGVKTKAALARAADVTRITINNLYAGVPPKYETICKLIEALMIPEDQIGRVFYAKEEPVGQTDSSE